jgi:ADP-heptose:LPS heptosyltransferase
LKPRQQALLADARRALLVRLRSLGDAVLMTPVPTVLKAWRSSLHVAVLVEEPFAAVFRHHPAVDEVLTLPQRAGLAQRARCLARVRRGHYDIALNMHSGSTAGLLTALSGAPLRVAYHDARWLAACNVRVPGDERFWGAERVHTVLHQLTPLRHLGIPVPTRPRLELHVDPEARRRVLGRLAEHGLRAGRYIVMQPFSNWITKEWPSERFAALARQLRERYGLPIVVLAGPDEASRLERLLALAEGLVVAQRGVPVDERIAWVEQCGLIVGNDSGSAHAAAALGRPSVVIFGAADPRAWRPWSGEHRALLPDFPCIPCPADRCYEFESPRCVESVTVGQVLGAVAGIAPFESAAGPRQDRRWLQSGRGTDRPRAASRQSGAAGGDRET